MLTPETLGMRPFTLRCDGCAGKGVVGVYSAQYSTIGHVLIYQTTCSKCRGTGVYQPTLADLRAALAGKGKP